MPLAVTFAQAAAAVGYRREDPLVVAAAIAGQRRAHLARGCVPASVDPSQSSPASADLGRPTPASADVCAPGSRRLTTTTQVYIASLAKQVTAACTALLVHDGILDLDAPLADYVPDLPAWAETVRIRHLVHHTSGLAAEPAPSPPLEPADDRRPPERTTSGLLAAAVPGPTATPGTRFGYSNIGYVCLATAVENAAGEPFGDFARRRIFDPLGMADTLFWDGPEPGPPGAAPLDPAYPAPLSLGDGGMWSTAADLLGWCAGLNDDRLGITALIQTPGRLDDGTELDYAWGMRALRVGDQSVYWHSGSHADVRTKLARVPERGFDLVILALADQTERSAPLTEALVASQLSIA
jgi:CubicO group peptidase (beta-lactamase class C family)